jgi:predicted acetyltransferase
LPLAQILNVYTEPGFRRRGLAGWLVEAALHRCKANEVDRVILHASREGRGLYELLGFQTTHEMQIKLSEVGRDLRLPGAHKGSLTVAKSPLQCAGINRHEAEDERALRVSSEIVSFGFS